MLFPLGMVAIDPMLVAGLRLQSTNSGHSVCLRELGRFKLTAI